MSTFVPIRVIVPGSGGEELWYSPAEARLLVKRLERELRKYEAIREKFGVSAARKADWRPYASAWKEPRT